MRFFKYIKFVKPLKLFILIGVGFYFTLMQSAMAEMSVIGSSNSTLKIEKVAVFDEPWALTFINQNDLLVSTKKGKLWLVEKDGTKSAIEGLPEITYGGQGGLGDILPHPNFKQNNLLYLSFVTSKIMVVHAEQK